MHCMWEIAELELGRHSRQPPSEGYYHYKRILISLKSGVTDQCGTEEDHSSVRTTEGGRRKWQGGQQEGCHNSVSYQ